MRILRVLLVFSVYFLSTCLSIYHTKHKNLLLKLQTVAEIIVIIINWVKEITSVIKGRENNGFEDFPLHFSS
jgi:hypothetical protein